MSAKQCGTYTFMGTVTFRHDDPPTAARLDSQQPSADEKREMVAVLAALSVLNNTKLLRRANAYMVGKLKAKLSKFNATKNEWQPQKNAEDTKRGEQ